MLWLVKRIVSCLAQKILNGSRCNDDETMTRMERLHNTKN
jgi:hypothetical protein